MQEHTKNKVAIYHTGALGDLLVSTATIYESIQYYPQSEFTLIGSKLWKEIISPAVWPQIKYILEVKNKSFTQLKLWKVNANGDGWEEATYLYDNIKLFLRNFDVTIDFRTESLRFAWRALLAKVPTRIGGSKSLFSKFFFTHFSLEKSRKNIHERDRYLEVLKSLNGFQIQERINYWIENGLPPLSKNVPSAAEKKLFLINPTASIREKAWPSEKFRHLAFKLKENGHQVVIIGSPNETDWLKEVASEDFQIIQPRRLFDLIDIVGQAKYLLTNTSSMQFIAASTRTPTLTLIGSAEPQKWGPLGVWSCFVKGQELRMNSNLFKPKKKAGKLNEVLSYNSISVADVLAKINEFK